MDDFVSREDLEIRFLIDSVKDNFFAFVDFCLDGFLTDNVSEILTNLSHDKEMSVKAIKELVKIAIMTASDEMIAESTDKEELYQIETAKELVQNKELDSMDSLENFEKEIDSLENAINDYKASKKRIRKSAKKIAGRVFSEEEKIALIEEDGISRHVLNGIIL